MSSNLINNTHSQAGAFALANNAVTQVAASGVQVALDNTSTSVDNMSASAGTFPLLHAAENHRSAFYVDLKIYPTSAVIQTDMSNQPSLGQEPKRRARLVASGRQIGQEPKRQQESYGTPWRPATRIVASGSQTIALCPDREQSLLAPQKLQARAIADPETFESNQRQNRADKLRKSEDVNSPWRIKQSRRRKKCPKQSPRLAGGSLDELRREKALVARLAKKKRTLTRKNQRDLKSEKHKNNDLCNDLCSHCGDEFTPATNHLEPYCPTCVKFSNNGTCELEYEEEHLRQTFYMTLSVINRPGNHAMPLPCIWQPWFSQAIDDNKSSKGYMLLMRTHARNIGAEFNADYLSHTYWLQSNPGEMTHAAYFDYPYQVMYPWIYNASCDVNTDLLLKFQDRQCAICLEKIAMNCCIKGCNGEGGKRHLFHAKCLESWIGKGHRNCPSCRGELFFPVYPHDPVLRGPHWEEVWTWFPYNYRLAETRRQIKLCLASAEESKSEPAQHAEPAENVIIPLEERTNSMSRRHVEYLDHEAYVNGENDSDDDPWDDMTEEEWLIGTRLSPPTTAEEHEETPEGSGEPAQSEPAEHAEPAADVMPAWAIKMDKEERLRQKKLAAPQQARELYGLPANVEPAWHAKMVQKRKEETPEQLLVEDIQQCCIRLAHETNDQGFKHDLYQYNDLIVEAAYAVYLEDRNWEEFKDTCTRILAHFRAEYDDYGTDPEDKAADLNDD